MSIVIGVDIGGSHITAAIVDPLAKAILSGTLNRKAVDSEASADVILSEWSYVIKQTISISSGDIYKVGIAMPGPFDYEEGISLITDQAKFKSLYKLNIKNALAERIGISPARIKFINDAAGFLQGEIYAGAVSEFTSILGLTLGTGLGSALSKDGEAWDADLWKSVFKNGIAEDYISTRWFVKRYHELSGTVISGVKEFLEVASDVDKKNIFFEFSNNLKQFLIPQIKKHELQGVLFGGNISNAWAHFFPEIEKSFIEEGLIVTLKKSVLNENAALIGAASLWLVYESEKLESFQKAQ